MKKFILVVLTIFLSSAVFCQSADVVTEILDSEQFSCGQACYLIAVSKEYITDDVSVDRAILVLEQNNILTKKLSADEAIKLSDYACILARSIELKGGLMYRITKASPRYALKQLKSMGVVPEKYDPSMILTGQQALSIYTSLLYATGLETLSGDL